MLVDINSGKELQHFQMVKLTSNELVTLFSWEAPEIAGQLGKVCIIDSRGVYRVVSPMSIRAEFRGA